jgi:hypothetical protein
MFFYPKLLYNFDMFRELQMLAKIADDHQPSEHVQKLVAGGAEGLSGKSTVIPALGSIPLSMLARRLVTSNEGYPTGSVPKTEKELQELVQKLEEGHNLDLRVRTVKTPAESEYRRSYPWSRSKWEELKLAPGSNPQTIAHEFGHAIQPHKLEKGLNVASLLARTPAATALPSILALSGGMSESEETPAYAKAAPYLGGAQLATILGEETRANIRALKLLKQKGIPLTTLQKLRQFVPSTSYLGRGALLVGAPLGILKGMDLYEKSRKTEHPFTIKQMAKATPSSLSALPPPEDIKKKWEERLSQKEG